MYICTVQNIKNSRFKIFPWKSEYLNKLLHCLLAFDSLKSKALQSLLLCRHMCPLSFKKLTELFSLVLKLQNFIWMAVLSILCAVSV